MKLFFKRILWQFCLIDSIVQLASIVCKSQLLSKKLQNETLNPLCIDKFKYWSFESVEQWSPHKNIFKPTKFKKYDLYFALTLFLSKSNVIYWLIEIKQAVILWSFAENNILWDSTPPTYSEDYYKSSWDTTMQIHTFLLNMIFAWVIWYLDYMIKMWK